MAIIGIMKPERKGKLGEWVNLVITCPVCGKTYPVTCCPSKQKEVKA